MKSLIIANWKMNPATFKEAKSLFEDTKHMTGLMKNVTVVVAPPALYLRPLADGLRKGRLTLAVQNAHFEANGAHTGEISMQQARDAKAEYVLIGHAERRAMGETNEETGKKVAAALATGLTPVLCIGEKMREGGAEHFNFVREQLHTALTGSEGKLAKIIIVYEPLWVIGKDSAMKPRDMHEMSIFIRKALVEKFGDIGHKVTVLYGGSVDATSAPLMLQDGDVKGLLVGRASWRGDTFAELLRAVNTV
ncbi:MAG: triose-phosphate isomerase [Minisyncoccia bacterium]